MKKYISLWKNLPDSAKSSILFVFSTFLLKAISFLTTPVFTRIMEPSQYGIVTNYNSWVSIIEVFALLGLTSAGVLNVGLNDYRTSRNRYLSSLLGLTNIATLLTFAVLLLLRLLLDSGFWLSDELLMIMFVHFLFHPAQIFWMTKQRYEFHYKASTAVTIGSVLISQLLSVILVMSAQNNLGNIRVLANELGTLLFAVPLYILLLARGRAYINLPLWKSVLSFALPLIPHYLAQHIMSSSDRIMITELIGMADTGIYGVVANVGTIAMVFWSAINASIVPITFESINRNEFVKLKKTINSILTGYGIACAGIILIAPEVLNILAPKEYHDGVYAIPPLVAVSFLNALYNVYANVEFYYKKSSTIASSTITATLLNLILNFLLIPRYSYTGAAYATLISNAVLIWMHYCGYRKCNNKIYNDRYIGVLTVSILAFVCISNVLYISLILRIFIAASILIGCLVNYKKILKILRSILKEWA